MKDQDISTVMAILSRQDWGPPVISQLAETDSPDPFLILIATILSLRTKDEVTALAAPRLFALAKTPEEMLALPEEEIARVIYPVGFYRTKASTIHRICRELISRFGSRAPATLEDLLTLKGVGRKTANLVLALGYSQDAICVDIHVHRISNRLGYIQTKTPDESEFALREKLPRSLWQDYNTLMVAFGRSLCRPVSPFCSRCPVVALCDQAGFARKR